MKNPAYMDGGKDGTGKSKEKSAAVEGAEKESHAHTEPFILRRNIRSTAYEVAVYFSKTSRETLTDKIRRLIRNEIRQ
jgi:hypothetical protein